MAYSASEKMKPMKCIPVNNNWAEKMSKTSNRLTQQINSIIRKDEECSHAFNDFFRAIKTIYPSVTLFDCVHMISDEIIIKPIQKSLFNSETKSFKPLMSSLEQKVIATLQQYQITDAPKDLNEIYEFIREKSLQSTSSSDRQQLIHEVYDNFLKKALPNRTLRHKKLFGS